jgi:hypothetical protein
MFHDLSSESPIKLTTPNLLNLVTYIASILSQVDNDFPEGDVDDMRAQMDSALLRYIAAAERKMLIQEKERERGGGAKKVEDRGEDEGDEEGRKAAKDREKKRSSSRKS